MLEVELIRIGKKEEYILNFLFDHELVENLKKLPSEGRTFSLNTKLWTLSCENLNALLRVYKGRKDIFFKFSSDKEREHFVKYLEKNRLKKEKKRLEALELENFNKKILDVKANLPQLAKSIDYKKFLNEEIIPYAHQLEGAYLSKELNNNLIIAAGLGSGKSLCSLIATENDERIKKILIICPNSLKLNWKNEITRFTKQKSFLIKWSKGALIEHPRNEGLVIADCKYIIVHYDYFRDSVFDFTKKVVDLGLDKVDCIIFDEAHKLSYTNNTSDNIKRILLKKIKSSIMLTGTPIKNKLENLFRLLKIVKPSEFSNQSHFFINYCGLRYDVNSFGGWVEDKRNPAKLDQLHEKLQTCMYRVVTADVIKNLPKQIVHKVTLELSESDYKTYKEVEKGFSKVDWDNKEIKKTENDEVLPIVILNNLRQLTAKFKIDYVTNFIKELNSDGEKVVVFDCFKNSLKALKDILGDNSEIYTGDVNSDKRQELVDKFQNPNSGLQNLLISMNAGNAGITLTASSNLILITESYLSDENLQAFARINRISQTKINNAFIIVCDSTIDELIYNKVQKQMQMIDKVIDGIDSVDSSKQTALGEILSELKNKWKRN